jgi:hypothetical protein
MSNPAADLFPSSTLVMFAFVSLIIYIFLLRPILPSENAANRTRTTGAPNANNGQGVRGQQQQVNPNANNANGWDRPQQTRSRAGNLSEAAMQLLSECASIPPHCDDSNCKAGAGINGCSVLVDGLVSFRFTKAAGVASTKPPPPQPEASNEAAAAAAAAATQAIRKERARLLSRVGGSSGAQTLAPPLRGSTVVVSLPHADVGCAKLQRVLFLLATYYNVFVVVDVSDNSEITKESLLKALRSGVDLTEMVLPSHRVLLASKICGRVALVRQLQRVELMIDFHPDVKEQLGRFGYRVFVYGDNIGNGNSKDSSVSLLGAELLGS